LNAGLIEVEPAALIAELVSCITSSKQLGLREALRVASDGLRHVSKYFEPHISALLRSLDYFARDTALPPSIPRQPAAREKVEQLPAIRAEAARLAFALFQYHKRQSLSIPAALERWRDICKRDVLPEVRRQWRDQLDGG
jgi:hypothetical protein